MREVGGSYLVGLFATVGHLLDGHHLIGADIMGLTRKVEGQQTINDFFQVLLTTEVSRF